MGCGSSIKEESSPGVIRVGTGTDASPAKTWPKLIETKDLVGTQKAQDYNWEGGWVNGTAPEYIYTYNRGGLGTKHNAKIRNLNRVYLKAEYLGKQDHNTFWYKDEVDENYVVRFTVEPETMKCEVVTKTVQLLQDGSIENVDSQWQHKMFQRSEFCRLHIFDDLDTVHRREKKIEGKWKSIKHLYMYIPDTTGCLAKERKALKFKKLIHKIQKIVNSYVFGESNALTRRLDVDEQSIPSNTKHKASVGNESVLETSATEWSCTANTKVCQAPKVQAADNDCPTQSGEPGSDLLVRSDEPTKGHAMDKDLTSGEPDKTEPSETASSVDSEWLSIPSYTESQPEPFTVNGAGNGEDNLDDMCNDPEILETINLYVELLVNNTDQRDWASWL